MITVITGAPCSGKTAYARQHAKPGDVIIDFDAIAAALGSPEDHDHDPRLREITAAAWAAAVDRTIATPGITAWIIDSRPTRQRQHAYRQARARITGMSATAGELHRRADADGRGGDVHQRIDAFLAAMRRRDPEPVARTRW